MEYCNYCGGKIKEDANFCKHCGEYLQNNNSLKKNDRKNIEKKIDNKDTYQDNDSKDKDMSKSEEKDWDFDGSLPDDKIKKEGYGKHTSEKSKNRLVSKRAKKQNRLVLYGIVLIVFLLASYIILNKMYSPTHIVNEFEDAMMNKNSKALSSLLTTDNEDIELDENAVNAFIELYSSRQSELKNMVDELNHQANNLSTSHNSLPVELKKDGKKLLLFDNYKLNVLPVYISVSTTYEDTDIIVNKEKLTTTDEDYFNGEVGPVAPGLHKIKAVYDTGFFQLDKEVEVEAANPTHAELVDLHLDGDEVSFDLATNGYDQLASVKLFINEKETNYDLIDESKVGPLLTDGSMKATFEADFPWGTMMTDPVAINDSHIKFNFGNSEKFRETLMDLIINFNEEYMVNYTNEKPKGFTTTNEITEDDILEEVSINKEEDVVYKGAFHGVDFYLDSFELKKSYDDVWEVKIDTITYFEEVIYQAGEMGELEQTEEEIRYEAAFDPKAKEWLIVDLGYSGSMDPDNMERYKVKDPEIYTSEWDKEEK